MSSVCDRLCMFLRKTQSTLPLNTVTHTCAAENRSRVYVLAQASKRDYTQCVCKSHPEFQSEQLVQNFWTYTRMNTVFAWEPHEVWQIATCGSRAAGWPGLLWRNQSHSVGETRFQSLELMKSLCVIKIARLLKSKKSCSFSLPRDSILFKSKNYFVTSVGRTCRALLLYRSGCVLCCWITNDWQK